MRTQKQKYFNHNACLISEVINRGQSFIDIDISVLYTIYSFIQYRYTKNISF